MEPLIVFVPSVILMAVVSRWLAAQLSSRAYPLIFLIVFTTFVGFFNNLYDRHPVIHASKFVILGYVFLIWLVGRRSHVIRGGSVRPRIHGLLLCLAATYVIQLFNPNWSSLTVGLLNGAVGIFQFLLPASLLYMAMDLVEERRHIAILLWILVGLSTTMALFGIVQYVLGFQYVASLSDGFSKTLHREHLWFAGMGDNDYEIRPVSFASDAGAASKYYCLGLIATATLLASRTGERRLVVLVGVAIVQAISLWLTMVRSSVLGAILGITIVLVLQGRTRHFALLGSLLLSIVVANQMANNNAETRFATLLNPDNYVESRGMQVQAIFWLFDWSPLGMGAGRVGPGGNWFSTGADRMYTVPEENLFVCIVFETGILGGLLAGLLMFRAAIDSIRIVLHLSDPVLRSPAAGLLAVVLSIIVMSFSGPTLYTVPTSYIFWAFLGLLYKIEWLDAHAHADEGASGIRRITSGGRFAASWPRNPDLSAPRPAFAMSTGSR